MSQQLTTNSLGLLLLDVPFTIAPNLKFYQPKVRDVVVMGEERYELLTKIWSLERHQLVPEENEYTKKLDDFSIWNKPWFHLIHGVWP